MMLPHKVDAASGRVLQIDERYVDDQDGTVSAIFGLGSESRAQWQLVVFRP